VFATALVAVQSIAIAAGETVNIVDSAPLAGYMNSLALDAEGFPVISYLDATNQDLKLAHCNDADCAGGDESISTVDSEGVVGFAPSLVLDGAGFPVISYHDATNQDLKLAHCNDADCAGGDESISTVDSAADVGGTSFLVLDGAGSPVISYRNGLDALKVAHCNDPACAGGDEATSTFVFDRIGGPSMRLDSAGFPVTSFWNHTTDLTVLHCNDADCAGGDESINTVFSTGILGDMSLAIDASGFPVIGFTHLWPNGEVTVAHCNDADCAGGDESLHNIDKTAGTYVSLALDGQGLPVVSYFTYVNNQSPDTVLMVAHCNDADCAGDDESREIVGIAGTYGANSLALDGAGFPVLSFYDFANGDLMLARCDDAACSPDNDGDGVLDVDEHDPNTLPSTGSSTSDVSVWALALLGAGAVLIVTSRARRH
jgi:LPXTG-motif cell wall-anchored protein